ncbi:MAG: type II toxin-antitoxin system Phd/YefM family antitoxin [Deltaproteobacteria bacterium]|nr:type II toxin-antitoxin system Phd/YefM family antitoxin [Deltaproteobacteria bacterium]
MKFMPISDARAKLASIVGEKQTERIVLTRRGKPESVLLDYDDFRSLQALADLISNPDTFAAVLEAIKKFRSGDLTDFVDLPIDE